ncbi:MAG TPA: hypothetical protein VMK65_10715 [Longimicrobiales bacterium]|nr:hypothetical protein [Longimicrobiales bacterium]
MPVPGKLAKATLTELWPDSEGKLTDKNKDGGTAKKVTVQFNPQTLKVALTNQAAGGNQAGGGASQFVGQGTTKLSIELWFDAQLPLPEGTADPNGDVRNLTRDVAYFMTPQEVTRGDESGLVPPGIQFLWGTFLFKGVVESMDETLEHFSEDGHPLRAMVALRMAKQDLVFEFGKAGGGGGGALGGPPGGGGGGGAGGSGGGGAPAGTTPMTPAKQGETVQQMAARSGARDWKSVAAANGIENPRLVPPGTLVDLSGRARSAAGALAGPVRSLGGR